MQSPIDKRDRARLFRDRLASAMAMAGRSQASLARAVGVDRSTLSQLLMADSTRLPNAQVVAECASALGVSCDWLLGLSDRRESAAELIAAAMTMTEAPRALVDERIFGWHQEAEGYKIRHVPAGTHVSDALVTVTFEDVQGKTLLTITSCFDSALTAQAFRDMQMVQGWGMSLNRLERVVATAPPAASGD